MRPFTKLGKLYKRDYIYINNYTGTLLWYFPLISFSSKAVIILKPKYLYMSHTVMQFNDIFWTILFENENLYKKQKFCPAENNVTLAGHVK